jgi:hypothetical protein
MEELLRLYSKLTNKATNSAKTEMSFFRLYIINPLSAGILGFSTFFFFETLIGLTARLLGLINQFKIGPSEISLAAIGFVLQFTLQILSNLK